MAIFNAVWMSPSYVFSAMNKAFSIVLHCAAWAASLTPIYILYLLSRDFVSGDVDFSVVNVTSHIDPGQDGGCQSDTC